MNEEKRASDRLVFKDNNNDIIYVQSGKFFNVTELVDKATPKKPFWNGPDCYTCRNCQNYVIDEYTQRGVYLIGTTTLAPFEVKYCPNCGQAIDWSTDELNQM